MPNKPARTNPPKGTVTVMFTDIVGSTALRDALVAEHGEDGNQRYRERCLDPHDERIRALLAEHNGFEVKTNGDSFMVTFDNASDGSSVPSHSAKPAEPPDPDGSRTIGGSHRDAHRCRARVRDQRQDRLRRPHGQHRRPCGSAPRRGERVYCSGITAAEANLGATNIRKHSYGPYLLKGVSAPIEIVDLLWDEAMQPAPPPKVDDRLRHPWLTPWIGRDGEMTEVEDALMKSRLVTLLGTGGVGKTRLAVETLLARRGELPRDLVFVSIEMVADPSEGFLSALRDALGLPEVDAPTWPAFTRIYTAATGCCCSTTSSR